MNKIEIEVPINVRYISDWLDFNTDLLKGHSIINKTITGCGFTHYCLTNNIPTILCSPRKFLLENKHEQLPNTYLVINEGEKSLDVDGDEQSKSTVIINDQTENLEVINILQDNLRSYIFNCQISSITPKILVTYDSLRYVLEIVGSLIPYYSVIVDEFQNIFMDSRFKADTELNFLSYLQSCPNVTYLSATPYIEDYLNELDEFKLLPYYELKWHPDRLQTIKIDPKKTSNLSREIDKIISDYKEQRFPEKVCNQSGIIYQSREVVFYVNSIRMICSIIVRNNLTPDQVNIICADTDKNKKSLNKIGHCIGKAPGKGKPHKMFTFCTRTTYAGADFYSTSALSVIVSDCKIDSLATDIRMDFPQIMGRQRLKENVFRDECIFIYKLSDSTITMEEFEKLSKKKLKVSESDLSNYSAVYQQYLNGVSTIDLGLMVNDYRLRIKVKKYGEDYTGIDEKNGQPKINKLVMISERRAFELRSNVYKSEVQIYNEFADLSLNLSTEEYIEKSNLLFSLKERCRSKGSFEVKMKAVCDILLDPRWFGKIHASDLYWLPISYRNYLNILGPERIRACGYIEAELKRDLFCFKCEDELKNRFLNEFKVNNRYTLKYLKEKIKEIYDNYDLSKSPKATDILEFFEVKEVFIYDPHTKKQSKGYEILGLK